MAEEVISHVEFVIDANGSMRTQQVFRAMERFKESFQIRDRYFGKFNIAPIVRLVDQMSTLLVLFFKSMKKSDSLFSRAGNQEGKSFSKSFNDAFDVSGIIGKLTIGLDDIGVTSQSQFDQSSDSSNRMNDMNQTSSEFEMAGDLAGKAFLRSFLIAFDTTQIADKLKVLTNGITIKIDQQSSNGGSESFFDELMKDLAFSAIYDIGKYYLKKIPFKKLKPIATNASQLWKGSSKWLSGEWSNFRQGVKTIAPTASRYLVRFIPWISKSAIPAAIIGGTTAVLGTSSSIWETAQHDQNFRYWSVLGGIPRENFMSEVELKQSRMSVDELKKFLMFGDPNLKPQPSLNDEQIKSMSDYLSKIKNSSYPEINKQALTPQTSSSVDVNMAPNTVQININEKTINYDQIAQIIGNRLSSAFKQSYENRP